LRRPSAEELEILTLAFRLFAPTRSLPRVAVLDDPLPIGGVRGLTVIVSRALVESDSLAAALAHECGHLWSLDGRLTEAVDRLAIWEDPLGPPAELDGRRVIGKEQGFGGGPLYHLLRLVLRLAGGNQVRSAFGPLWSAYWRRREFVADAAAVAVGQGPDLARHLRDEVLPFDISRPMRVFNHAEHAPTALRIERLAQASRMGGTK
jgi:Zn-dependent protease with chaperone function